MMVSSNNTKKIALSPGMSWLIVFVPAFGYVIFTRLLSGSGGDMGTLVTNHIQACIQVPTVDGSSSSSVTDLSSSACCEIFQSLFYLKNRCDAYQKEKNDNNANSSPELTLKYGLMNVLTIQVTTAGSGGDDDTTTTTTTTTNQQHSRNNRNNGIIDMQWIHDEEIGRGYLLYSTGNQIWRWERGGGPIPIGRTLHLDNAGCRSNIYQQCDGGENEQQQQLYTNNNNNNNNNFVGAITTSQELQRYNNNKNDNNNNIKQIISKIPVTKELTIAEWGEQRIVRFENEIGSRTPLLLEIPNICTTTTTTSNSKQQTQQQQPYTRVSSSSPERMVYTPPGHLLLIHDIVCEEVIEEEEVIIDERSTVEGVPDTGDNSDVSSTTHTKRIVLKKYHRQHRSIIVQLTNAVHIPALPNLQSSRKAHSWTTMNYSSFDSKYELTPPTIFWSPPESDRYMIYGMELSPTGESLYISVQYSNGTMSILEFSLLDDIDDDDKDDNDDDAEEKRTGTTGTSIISTTKQPKLVYDITNLLHQHGHNSDTQSSKYQIGDFVITPSGTIIVAVNDVVNYTDSYLLTILDKGGVSNKKNGQVPLLASMMIPILDENNGNPVTNQIKDGIITAVELGTDGYLYVAVSSVLSRSYSLNRIRIKEKVTW